jgi:hypothetical protein
MSRTRRSRRLWDPNHREDSGLVSQPATAPGTYEVCRRWGRVS